MKKTLATLALLALSALSAQAHEYTAGTLKIGHPWARPTVAGQPTGGAFLKLQNTGPAADRLVGGSTPAADHVEMHRMAMEGDVMKMREVPAIEIPAGQTIALQPGELHLMLVGLKAPLQAGAKVPLTLKFEKAGAVNVELKIEAPAPQSAAPASGAHQH
jgi:copper(I)-binding protein